MPYLQLDVCAQYSIDVKRQLAKRIGSIYSNIMQVTPSIVTVAIRELGEGGVWRCSEDEPDPAGLLMCDIRRGRPPETREELARQIVAACVELLGLRTERLNVEFTQHTGDEMYHPMRGGLSREWVEGEAAAEA
jgi:phenylpyruvate tautomerase PptA (4-oxalocrotonate tautomerase family)